MLLIRLSTANQKIIYMLLKFILKHQPKKIFIDIFFEDE